jgi:hypothetical protein
MHERTTHNIKTVGIQWFAKVLFPIQHSCQWTSLQPENPTVSYCQTLAGMHRDGRFIKNMKLWHMTKN